MHVQTDTMAEKAHRYRVVKTHRMPYLYGSFPAKELYNVWLFCGK